VRGYPLPYGPDPKCHYDAPIVVSQPHFLHADDVFLRRVEGRVERIEGETESHNICWFCDWYIFIFLRAAIVGGRHGVSRVFMDSQILEPVRQFIHRPVCIPFYVSKFQRSSSNGLEMAAIQSQGMKIEILSLAENLLIFQLHDFFFLVEFGGCKLAHLYCNDKNGHPLPGAKQFRRNKFSTSADFLFLLLFSKQLRHNQFSKWYGDQPTDGPTNGRTNQPTDRRTNGPANIV
jgi:hypothetical protein